MESRLRRIVAWSVLTAVAIAEPAISQPPVDHARAILRLASRASQSFILPHAERRLLLVMVNRVRQTHGRLAPLIMDGGLRFSARRHSQDMALKGYVGHDSLDGRPVWSRLGWIVCPGSRVGENVAIVQTIEEGHRAFVASQGHLRNILDRTFHRAGIGVATAGDAGIMITEDFAE